MFLKFMSYDCSPSIAPINASVSVSLPRLPLCSHFPAALQIKRKVCQNILRLVTFISIVISLLK